VSSELKKAKERADQALQEAVTYGYSNLGVALRADYRIALWSNSIEHMYKSQWCAEVLRKDRGWDWHEVHRRHRGPKDQIVALISGDRLAALMQISATRDRVKIGLLEGDSSIDCLLKPHRALIMLDLAATYDQVLGCNEIHLEALNNNLMVLYRDTYGFIQAPIKGAPLAMKRGLVS
jgi:hypothetical protein